MEPLKPGRELDALIAEKVMGWPQDYVGLVQAEPRWYINGEGSCRALWVYEVRKSKDNIVGVTRLWHPSEDIAAAWEVVDKLRAQGGFRLEFDVEWNAQLATSEWQASKTAPHAICVAALQAVESKNG